MTPRILIAIRDHQGIWRSATVDLPQLAPDSGYFGVHVCDWRPQKLDLPTETHRMTRVERRQSNQVPLT